jgi:hypothetical protein
VIHAIPGIEEAAQASSETVPPLVIATARIPQVVDDSSVNIALPSIQDELAVTPAHPFAGSRPGAHCRYLLIMRFGSSAKIAP